MKKLGLILVLFILAVAGAGFYARREWNLPGSGAEGGIVEIPRGLRARDIVKLLEEKKVVRNGYVALSYIFYSGARHKLQAGEYLFDHPMTVPEVIGKLASGSVVLHKFTVPEGLTVDEIARKWEEQGFGKTQDFTMALASALEMVHRFDDKAVSVEGYLFPETYSFPSHTTARQALEKMIGRFQQIVARLQQVLPPEKWPLSLHDTVILSSLVESEAAQPDERALIASVYLNRLNRHILLQCDTTVIYALEQADRYKGRLTLADLQFSSPYNTYVNAGLPPGPIANPGYASLLAAIQPAATAYLYFVRAADLRHTFSETLEAHNRAVAAYRKLEKAAPGRVRE
jgi:peptidoglycan lytic transglycosylase G